jgi:hypothetical protein
MLLRDKEKEKRSYLELIEEMESKIRELEGDVC